MIEIKDKKNLAKAYFEAFVGIFKYSATIGLLYPFYMDDFSLKGFITGLILLVIIFIITLILHNLKD
jgi:hypothetical protein